MASGPFYRRSDIVLRDQLPFSDILKFFNNPVNEEQAWAVCYQCAQYYLREQSQEKYQSLYENGLHSVCIGRDGEVYIQSDGRNGSGKGRLGGEYYAYRKHLASEHDAVQTLGRIIFEALDFGIGESEERTLSHELEVLIDTMTRCEEEEEVDEGETDTESHSADDEGIEKDAGDEHHCTFRDVAKLCTQHLTSRQEASYHYRAVCRALVAEAVELHTFLDKIAHSREKLQQEVADTDSRLLELERADWARLWIQVMRSLRQGVRLKKIDLVHHPPVEYELTPFEMLLEDIRSRRYTLHKIMVNGDIPPKVRKDAHAVILDFIRSRPPLRQVKDRKLKLLPPKSPDPRERLLQDIRAQPRLKPLPNGPAQQVETSRTRLSSEDSPPPVRKLIKPDFSLLLTSSFEDSGEDSEADSPVKVNYRHHSSPATSPAKDSMNATWPTEGVFGSGHDLRNIKLQRRHTIMVCESPSDSKLASLQELPPLKEEEEPSPTEDQTPRLQRGSHSPLSGLPDHTLHNGHTLLRVASAGRHQGALYRSEHRRSLTMGLTSIPEDEDGPDSAGGCDGGSVASRRHSLPAAPPGHVLGGLLPRTAQRRDPGECHLSLNMETRRDRRDGSDRGLSATDGQKEQSVSQEEKGESLPQDLALLTATQRMNKRWQNPIECLSLTLEEVTHIRSVLTKAELESLVAHPELYTQVTKSKVCFTCKTTRFTLFGEWGTKCRFCKRTVCSKCVRKMHVPAEPLKDVPVYTLCSTPLSKDTLALVQSYVKPETSSPSRSTPSSTATTRSPALARTKSSPQNQQKGKRYLQRSQSLTLPNKKSSSRGISSGNLANRGVPTSICCDCKSMVVEIVRASQTAITVLQSTSSPPSDHRSPLASSSAASTSSVCSSSSSHASPSSSAGC